MDEKKQIDYKEFARQMRQVATVFNGTEPTVVCSKELWEYIASMVESFAGYRKQSEEVNGEIFDIISNTINGANFDDINDAACRIERAGYRKQSEGEWIKTETNYTCSKCNFNVISWSGEYDGYECERGISLMNFCPNCGAKMKGGAE